MGNRPGVMIYFDIRPNLKLLTLEQRGILFDAILEYGELGVEPDLEGILAMAWGFIKPRIDKDGERYSRQIAQRQYATYCREKKRSNEEPLSFDAWMASKDNDCYRPMTEDDERYPTTWLPSTRQSLTTATSAYLLPRFRQSISTKRIPPYLMRATFPEEFSSNTTSTVIRPVIPISA